MPKKIIKNNIIANKVRISVVMIVKNEEALLARCLDSVKDADEIIICDTGSVDKTIKIAKKYTKKVYTDFKWCDDFSAARNHAKEKATGDWILSIDADEFCHDFSKVREAVNILGNALNVKMIAEDSDPERFFYFPRFFRNVPHIRWCGAVHNCLNIGPSRDSEIEITFGSSPAHNLDPDRTLRILEREVQKDPAPRELYYLGTEYFRNRDFIKTTEVLGRYIQVAYYAPEKADAFLLMARCYSTRGMDDDARDACAQAIIINPNFKEAVLFMAAISLDKNALQWKRMAETADNTGVLFQRIS